MGGYRRPVPPSLLVASDTEAVQRGARVLGAGLHPADGGRLATVPVETSLRHLHVIGPTGSGKSTSPGRLGAQRHRCRSCRLPG